MPVPKHDPKADDWQGAAADRTIRSDFFSGSLVDLNVHKSEWTLDKRKFIASGFAVVVVGFFFFAYSLAANLLLRPVTIADLDFEDALKSTLQFYFFGFPMAIYGMWRGWSKARQFVLGGTAVYLPIIVVIAAFSFNHSGAVSDSSQLADAYLMLVDILKNSPAIYLITVGYWLIVFRSPLTRWARLGEPSGSKCAPRCDASQRRFNRPHGDESCSLANVLQADSLKYSLAVIILSLNIAALVVLALVAIGAPACKASVFSISITITGSVSIALRAILLARSQIDQLTGWGIICMAILMVGPWSSIAMLISDGQPSLSVHLLLAFLVLGALPIILITAQNLMAMVACTLALFFPFGLAIVVMRADQWLSDSVVAGTSMLVIIGFGVALNAQIRQQVRLRLALWDAGGQIQAEAQRLERALVATEEAGLRIKQDYQERERFLQSIGHDFRQPIHALDLLLYQLSRTKLPNSLVGIVGACRRCAITVIQAIESISHLAWITGRVDVHCDEHFMLSPVFERLRIEFLTEASVKKTSIRIVHTSIRARADERLVERILRNFLSNAVRHTECGTILLGARRRGQNVEVLCVDTGPGISDVKREEIFEEFYQIREGDATAPGMLGMGLPIVKKLADLMNAKITLRSPSGNGSAFGIVLPMASVQ